MAQLDTEYRKARKEWTSVSGTGRYHGRQSAVQAFREAKIRVRWEAMDGDEASEFDEYHFSDKVRLLIVPDADCTYDCACDNVKCEQSWREHAERDGCWGIVGQYRSIEGGFGASGSGVRQWTSWVDTDAVFGFVGDDWRNSGYDLDIMESAMDAYDNERLVALAPAVLSA